MNFQNQKKIRLALIGASNIAAKVLPSMRKVPALDVIGVASDREGASAQFAQARGLSKAFNSYDECFNSAEVDAVYISNLSSDHAPTIRRALMAKKHVICEKPMVLNLRDAVELFSIAKSNGLILLEGFMYRFHPQVIELKKIIEAGGIGELKSIRASFSFVLYDLAKRPRRMTSTAGGGALFDIGCYLVDFTHFIMGVNLFPVEIKKMHSLDPNDSRFDFSTSAILKYQNGVIVELSTSLQTPSPNLWEVSGTLGSVSTSRLDPGGVNPVKITWVNQESVPQTIICNPVDQFEKQFENFANAILGLAPPHISAPESIQNAKLLEALSASS